MVRLRDLLAKKGTQVLSIGKDATVLDAALLMNEHRVGAVVVLERDRLVGMFTERDVLRRVVAERRDPARTPVGEVMTVEVVCGRPDTTLDEARGSMKHRRIRHLPVVDGDERLIGLISIGDLNAHDADTQEQTIHLMHEYIHGRV